MARAVTILGADGEISLGQQFAGRPVVVEEQEPGVWLIRTAVSQDDERWLLMPEARERLKGALAWAMNNPPDDSNVKAVLQRLHDAD